MARREDDIRPPAERRPARRDVVDLAADRRAPGRGEDPVMLARQIFEMLMRLMQLVPTLRPVIEGFLNELAQFGRGGAGRAGVPPSPRGRGGSPPPAGPLPEGGGEV
ncbi:MAG: hypothetical protein AB1478_05005 [Nitrospirota bacterium]